MRTQLEKVWYVFDCSCEMWVSEVKRDKHNKILCPVHGYKSKIVKRTISCIDCERKVSKTKAGGMPHRCPECSEKHRRKKLKEYSEMIHSEDNKMRQRETQEKAENLFKNPSRYPDCIFYESECMRINGYLLSKHKASCVGCERYQRKVLDVMDYVTVKDMCENIATNYC